MEKTHQSNDTLIEILELHPNEVELLNSIRNRWRWGEMTILIRDGKPVRLMRVQEFIDLTEKEKNEKR